jgi:hypothetical protein
MVPNSDEITLENMLPSGERLQVVLVGAVRPTT